MKRILPPPTRCMLTRAGVGVLAAALLATAGLAPSAFAADPTPSPSATLPASPVSTPSPVVTAPTSSPATQAQTTQAQTTATPSSDPSGTPQAAVDSSSAAARAAMAAAVGSGGAQMGQRSKRVASAAVGTKSYSTQALSTEGFWSPTFGVQGLDVSSYQTNVDWQQQWNMGARFAYVKASEGNYFTNSLFNSQYQGSRNVGMIRGAYHFAVPNWSSGADQARYFVQNGGGWSADGYTLPPVLDFEFNPYENRTINGFYFGNTCYGMSPSQLASWVKDFGATMSSLTGRLPVIYTNTSWWNQCLGNPGGFGDYPLWVASYPQSFTNDAGPIPSGSWGNYSIWQYSSTGPMTGDSNIWNGDYASLQRFAGVALPTGSFDELSLSRSGPDVSLRVRGWSVDLANVPASNQTHVYVTGPDGVTTGYPWTANAPRADVDQAFGYGPSHGFDGLISIQKSGTYKACAYSIGAFGNTPLGCKTLNATGVEAPTGSFDSLGQTRTSSQVSLQLRGWAVDLANPSVSSFADTYITAADGSTTGYRMPANTSRVDVQNATGLGTNHGFDYQVPLSSAGTYQACTYAIGQNSNRALGCKSIVVGSNPSPIGSYDSVSLVQAPNSANVQVTGWALEPTQPQTSTPVYVYLRNQDGTNASTPVKVTANLKRPDVNAALGTIGDHGFQASVPITSSGTYTLCVQAAYVAPLSNGPTSLGCKNITASPTPPTMGSLDTAGIQVSNGQASLITRGWTLDPSMPGSSNPVHVYITYPDGTRKGYAFTANLQRSDVNSVLQTIGDHGYSTSVPISARGQYSVCTYGVAVSVFSTGNTQLGCRTLVY